MVLAGHVPLGLQTLLPFVWDVARAGLKGKPLMLGAQAGAFSDGGGLLSRPRNMGGGAVWRERFGRAEFQVPTDTCCSGASWKSD